MSEKRIELSRQQTIPPLNKLHTCQLSPFDADLKRVSQYLSQAILLEVTTHPKPGLVTRMSNGAHNDMSIFTFMMSSAVLGKAFHDLQSIGQAHRGSLPELFKKVRTYGVQAEKELLQVTNGVNTQRGILFAGGIVSAASGYAMNMGLAKESLIAIVKEMTAGIVASELVNNKHKAMTAGEKLYHKYKITGIRGEVERGFPSVVNYGLPALNEALVKGASLNDALVHALLALMTVVEDSNVIWRTNYETLLEVQKEAKRILQLGSMFTPEGKAAIAAAEQSFLQRRISPGGSADLLSITITLYLLAQKEFPHNIF